MKKLCYLLLMMVLGTLLYATGESLCASVKIEIAQEMTLERQAFDAHMRINNGLDKISLDNVKVTVDFTDKDGKPVLASSDPANKSAKFFIKVDSMANINNVNGSGTVAPSTVADIHWLIIPTTGAANASPLGSHYFVGATLTYKIGGDTKTTVVTPDSIRVKPLPELELDYFLPIDVYGDDPFTTEIEPEVPFNLGVRVKNSGLGAAKKLKIESAQPKIVENTLGLLIGFIIRGSEVNGVTKEGSLLADFGTINAGDSGVARWIMTASLSGRFTEFNASYSHSDELGGKMTSLIKDPIKTHFLVRDVLVDINGRDSIRDFLAIDGNKYRVYESNSTDSAVSDVSSSSALNYVGKQGTEEEYRLSTPSTMGFSYLKLRDPFGGSKVIKEVVDGGGRIIKSDNVWFSKRKNKDSKKWEYYFNLFDTNGGGNYRVIFEDSALIPQPPVMQFIPDQTVMVDSRIGFIIEASDPNGDPVTISSEQLPVGATLTDRGAGIAEFDWTPATGQEGSFVLNFKASDGKLSAERKCTITVYSSTDSDGDGLPDHWEIEHFGSLTQDGKGDFDRDGHSDLSEYSNSTNPLLVNAPTAPQILAPLPGGESNSYYPEFRLNNSMTPAGDSMSYLYELYADRSYSNLLFSKEVAEEALQTSLLLTVADAVQLDENRSYYWRVRASDGSGTGRWSYGTFMLNSLNEAPQGISLSYPAEGSEVDSLTPYLEVNSAFDNDNDRLTYKFELYKDAAMTMLVDSTTDIAGQAALAGWQLQKPLLGGEQYYWRAIAVDEDGAETVMASASFRINSLNRAPAAPELSAPAQGSEPASSTVSMVVKNSLDPDYDSLTYHFELDSRENFSSPAKKSSPAVASGNSTTSWQVEGLKEDMTYYWRARAFDGRAYSRWTGGSFTVDVTNDLPAKPVLANPSTGAWVDTTGPTLTIIPPADRDDESFTYRVQLYNDEAMTNMIHEQSSALPEVGLKNSLSNYSWYYWRVQATDSRGGISPWSEPGSFYVMVSNLAPTANFSFSPAAPVSGESVTLDGSLSSDSDGNIIEYSWDLNGDGNYGDSYGPTVSHVFTKMGAYKVGLKVTDNGGMSAEKALTITVANRAPTAAFNYSPTLPYTGDTIALDASLSKDEDGQIRSYLWDINNDGTFGELSGKVVNHSFRKSGLKRVALKVIDGDGAENVVTKEINVQNRKPVITIKYSPAEIYTGQEITFSGADSTDDGTIVSYEWDINNDGIYGDLKGALVKHTFAALGSYPVGLKVTDNEGAAVKGALTIEVKNRLPLAKVSRSPALITAGSSVTFDALNSLDPDGTIDSYSWDLDNDGLFGDSTAKSVNYTFNTKGNYRLGLRLTDNDGGVTTHYEKVAVVDTAVPPVSSLSISAEGLSSYLSWTNSGHTWAGVRVLRKSGSYSDNSNDGTIIFEGASSFYNDSVTAGGEYFYTIYAYDQYGRYSTAVKGQLTLPAAAKSTMRRFRNGDGSAYSTMMTANLWQGDTYNRSNSLKVNIGRDEAGKIHDLWLYTPDLIGNAAGQIPAAGALKSAQLSLSIAGIKGNESSSYRVKVYKITDPDLLGSPIYAVKDGFQKGLNYNYRDNRAGMAVKWGAAAANIGELLLATTPLDSVEFIPAEALKNGLKTVTLDISGALKGWLAGEPNQGLYITISGSWSKGQELSLHGVTSLELKDRPLVEVVYSETAAPQPTALDSIRGTAAANRADFVLTYPVDPALKGVKVVRQAGRVPADPFDGAVVYDGMDTTFSDLTVKNGISYYYAAFTYDKDRYYGAKRWTKVTPGTAAAPTISSLLAADHIELSWLPVTGAERYRIYREESGKEPIILAETTAASYKDYNLELKSYTYRVSSLNTDGEGTLSNSVSETVSAIVTLPEAPLNAAVLRLSASEAKLSWEAGSANASSYVIEKRTGSGSWAVINTVPFSTTNIIDKSLLPGESYSYRIKAVNSAGDSPYSLELNLASSGLPQAIGDLKWQVISTASIKLTWSEPGSNVESYRVEVYRDGELLQTTKVLPKGTVRYYANGLEAETEYLIKVITVNSQGEAAAQTNLISTGEEEDELELW